MAAAARFEVQFVGAEDARRRMDQIKQAQARLRAEFEAGHISVEQLTRSSTRLNAANTILAGRVNTSSAALRRAVASSKELTGAQAEAATKAVLLGQTLGVSLPTSIQKLIVRSQAGRAAINALFSVSVVLSFASAISQWLFPVIGKLHTKILGIDEAVQAINRTTEAVTSSLGQLEAATVETIKNQIAAIDTVISKLEERLERGRARIGTGTRVIGMPLADLERLELAIEKAKTLRQKLVEIREVRDPLGVLRENLEDVAPELVKFVGGLQKFKKESKDTFDSAGDDAARAKDEFAALAAEFDKLTPLLFPSEADKKVLKLIEDLERAQEEQKKLAARLAEVPPGLFLSEADKQVLELIERMDAAKAKEEELARQAEELRQAHQQAFEQMTTQIEGFFQQVFLTARSFGDVWKQLLQQLLRLFISFVARMVAAWIMGLKQMRQAASGGLGTIGLGGALATIFGAILGDIFGGTGGVSTGAASSFAGRALSAGFGFMFGPGGTAPTFPTGGTGGGSATNINLLKELGIDLRSLGPISGNVLASGGLLAMLLGIQRGRPIIAALGGAAAGFAFGGPIGAFIGAVVGFFAGLFQRGRIRRQAARSEAQVFAQLKQIVEDFRQFKIDYESAIAQFDAVWADFVANAPRQFGRYGKRAVKNVAPFVAILRRQLVELQRTREARAKLIEELPLPEFQRGGIVDDIFRRGQMIQSTDGHLLAVLHRGEAVLNRGAVRALGEAFVRSMNRSGTPTPFVGVTRPAGVPPQIVININGARAPREVALEVARELRHIARIQGLELPF